MFKEFGFIAYLSILTIIGINIVGLTGFAEDRVLKIDSEIPRIDRWEYDEVETATFALGCFWGGDARFGAVPGVIRTRVGYAGGTTEDPTYYNLGDHTESIQIDYDPDEVTFAELVEIFWDYHNPTYRSSSTQYANVLYYHGPHQREVAEKSRERIAGKLGKEVYTQIKEISEFYPAEGYHQKYRLRGSGIFFDELKAIYPDQKDFRDSTAAARLNGYVAGHGNPEVVQKVVDKLGLSSKAQEELLRRYDLN